MSALVVIYSNASAVNCSVRLPGPRAAWEVLRIGTATATTAAQVGCIYRLQRRTR